MPTIAYDFYGANADAIKCNDAEVLNIGPAETGKTLAWLYKLHWTCYTYPNTSAVILRKTLASTYGTVLTTYIEKIIGSDANIQVYGGTRPSLFLYPNGSHVSAAGMDKSTRILSAEHDLIFANQVEELALDDWETLTTRTTGRAGHIPFPQTFGDANPSYPAHWMYTREGITRFFSWHKENPSLFNPRKQAWTKQGERTIERLSRLTGVRKTRLFEGRPAQAEGAIYDEWSDAVHLLYEDAVPALFRFVAGVDWGFTNPGAIGVWGIDGRNADMFLIEQHYHRKKLIDWWVERALELDQKHRELRWPIEAWVCDPSEPAYIEAFKKAGLNALPGYNGVRAGIDAVKQRLANAVKGEHPALYVVRDSLLQPDEDLREDRLPMRFEDEVPGYVWADVRNKETPVKENDHQLDGCRYACSYIDHVGEEQVQEVRSMI